MEASGRHYGRLLVAVLIVVVAVSAYWLSPLRPGPAVPRTATPLVLATEPAHLLPALGCPDALLAPARIAVSGDELVLVPTSGGEVERVIWPSGWVAWRLQGEAQLVARDGSLVGREGEVVQTFGGGVGADGLFHVCVIGQ